MSSNSISQHRERASKAQHCRCYYCGCLMCTGDVRSFAIQHGLTTKQARLLMATAEHLTARCEGGKDNAANIAAAHKFCNARRHNGKSRNAPSPAAYATKVRSRVTRGKWFPFAFSRG
jgi:hypothetical protein